MRATSACFRGSKGPHYPAEAMISNHPEHLNTPRLVADSTGTTVWRWDQAEPFGNNPADENPSSLGVFDLPLRLPGQRYDQETGLHYNYFRDYDPNLGRYGESDPIGLRGGINTYAYAHGQALTLTDPTGEQSPAQVETARNLVDCLQGCEVPPAACPALARVGAAPATRSFGSCLLICSGLGEATQDISRAATAIVRNPKAPTATVTPTSGGRR